jgi:hypothetical protein
MLTKRTINGVDVEIEFGVVGDKNPEHVANVHLLFKGLAHIRGIMVYHKPDGWVLKMPGYDKPGSKYKTAYILLSPEVIEFIIETTITINVWDYVKTYDQPRVWSIWGTCPKYKKDSRRAPHDGVMAMPYDIDEDATPIGSEVLLDGPDEGDRCNVDDAGDR